MAMQYGIKSRPFSYTLELKRGKSATKNISQLGKKCELFFIWLVENAKYIPELVGFKLNLIIFKNVAIVTNS